MSRLINQLLQTTDEYPNVKTPQDLAKRLASSSNKMANTQKALCKRIDG
jgi:hypothetical protein